MFKLKSLKLIAAILSLAFLLTLLFLIFDKNNYLDYGRGEKDLIITEGKTFTPGTYDYKTITIEEGVVTVNATKNSQGELTLRAQEKIVIGENGRIDLSGKGHKGLSAGQEFKELSGLKFDLAGGGGSHGGEGGYGCCISIKSSKTYGFSDISPSLGEGGGIGIKMDNGRGGDGGGFIKLVAPQIIIDGEIIANGRDGVDTGGGGAGGKIVLLSEEITLNGLIKAQGGEGGTFWFQGAGGGGGGIVILNIPPQGEGMIEVNGGINGKATDYYSGCHGGEGQAGKIFFELDNIL